MKRIIRKFSLLILAVSLFTVSYSQNPSTIILESQLTDIDGEIVQNAALKTSLTIINSAGEQCFEREEFTTTNNQGIFQLSLQDFAPLFINNFESGPVVIQLTIVSNDNGKWLEEDEFEVKYLLKSEIFDGFMEYSITRMEGQKLNYEYQSDIWMFTDIYYFAYIKTMFLLSFNDDITDPESLLLAAKSMFDKPEAVEADEAIESPAPPPSRGIKGGYAVGGYNKTDDDSEGDGGDDDN